ncbi:hypothetical protein BCR43DRAFT_520716 [Syncephalastrum racemosum]|uniref:Uncharacterized protein n=1 Tax=Syncephalastrum racemosum TaxID=13706 RepID=A0A1X2HVH0_SYNRA|nr:hypothetical protein BCR43DRAFT_520716 [Syncephalastrum racemosum]
MGLLSFTKNKDKKTPLLARSASAATVQHLHRKRPSSPPPLPHRHSATEKLEKEEGDEERYNTEHTTNPQSDLANDFISSSAFRAIMATGDRQDLLEDILDELRPQCSDSQVHILPRSSSSTSSYNEPHRNSSLFDSDMVLPSPSKSAVVPRPSARRQRVPTPPPAMPSVPTPLAVDNAPPLPSHTRLPLRRHASSLARTEQGGSHHQHKDRHQAKDADFEHSSRERLNNNALRATPIIREPVAERQGHLCGEAKMTVEETRACEGMQRASPINQANKTSRHLLQQPTPSHHLPPTPPPEIPRLEKHIQTELEFMRQQRDLYSVPSMPTPHQHHQYHHQHNTSNNGNEMPSNASSCSSISSASCCCQHAHIIYYYYIPTCCCCPPPPPVPPPCRHYHHHVHSQLHNHHHHSYHNHNHHQQQQQQSPQQPTMNATRTAARPSSACCDRHKSLQHPVHPLTVTQEAHQLNGEPHSSQTQPQQHQQPMLPQYHHHGHFHNHSHSVHRHPHYCPSHHNRHRHNCSRSHCQHRHTADTASPTPAP